MARRPNVQSDRDNWGEVLNEYLDVSLDEDGTLRAAAVQAGAVAASDTTFNSDGSITVAGDVPATTTFGADGTITTVYGAPVNKTVTTTFGADGTITEDVT